MPKKILVESAIHQLAAAGLRRLTALDASGKDSTALRCFLRSLQFEPSGSKFLHVHWSIPSTGSCELDFTDAKFYQRGDTALVAEKQREAGLSFAADSIAQQNQECFDRQLDALLAAAGIALPL